jgi:hypothetical protein
MRALSSIHRSATLVAILAASWLPASPSPTIAAVFEIDQLCALSGGCFPGDSAGFPVTITQPGTYRLTSNLDVRGAITPEDVTAIEIAYTAEATALDLNGFAVIGPNTCLAPPIPCAGNGTGIGVKSSAEGSVVANGSVFGFGSDGVSMTGYGARVDRVRVWWNGAKGIDLEFGAGIINDSAAWRNGNDGIHNDSGTTTGSTAVQNVDDGFYLDGTSSGSELNAWGNGGSGFYISSNLQLSFSVANANLGSGLAGHVHASVGDANGQYGLWAFNAFYPYTSTLNSVYANNAIAAFSPEGVTSLGQNACNGGGC